MPQTWTARLFEISAIESAAQGYNNLLHGAKIPFGKQKFPCQTHVVSDLKALAAPWQLTAGHLTTSIISSSVHSARSWNTSKKFKESMTSCDQYANMWPYVFLIPSRTFQFDKEVLLMAFSCNLRAKEVKGSTTSCSVPGTSVRGSYPQPKSVMESTHCTPGNTAHGLKTEVQRDKPLALRNHHQYGHLRFLTTERKEKWKNFSAGKVCFCALVRLDV